MRDKPTNLAMGRVGQRVAPMPMVLVLGEVVGERRRQDDHFPIEDGGFNPADRLAVLVEEVGEVARVQCGTAWGAIGGSHATQRLREELVQVAAVAVRWIEAIDEEADDAE